MEFRWLIGKNVGVFETCKNVSTNVCFFDINSNKTWVNLYKMFFFRYTKPKGQLPDYNSPIVLHSDHTSVEDFCNKLHRSIAKEFK